MIKIKYFDPDYPKLENIENKSNWIDLRAAEEVKLSKDKHYLIPLGLAVNYPPFRP